jgi:uncharacterized protein (DUF1684 family)
VIRRSAKIIAYSVAISIFAAFPAYFLRIAHAQTVSAQPAATNTLEAQSWQQNLAAWRKQREMQVSAPDGWLTLAGLEWLKSGVNTIGSAADNTIHLPQQAPAHLAMLTVMSGGHATSAKDPGATVIQLLSPIGGFPPEFTMDGKPAREGPLRVEGIDASTMTWRGLNFAVLKRGDRFVLRIKDADSPLRTGFHGLNWYQPNPAYRVTAHWIPFIPPIVEEIPTVLGTTLKVPAPGLAMFMLDNKIMRLEPVIEDPASKSLFFILRDETSKTTTFGGGRFLHTGLPDHGLAEPGSLVLDFNQLENPPCAYTNYATCPLPPKQNQLETEIPAGEKRYQR